VKFTNLTNHHKFANVIFHCFHTSEKFGFLLQNIQILKCHNRYPDLQTLVMLNFTAPSDFQCLQFSIIAECMCIIHACIIIIVIVIVIMTFVVCCHHYHRHWWMCLHSAGVIRLQIHCLVQQVVSVIIAAFSTGVLFCWYVLWLLQQTPLLCVCSKNNGHHTLRLVIVLALTITWWHHIQQSLPPKKLTISTSMITLTNVDWFELENFPWEILTKPLIF